MDKLKKILQNHPDTCNGMPNTPKSSVTAVSEPAESPQASPREFSELALAPYPEDPDEQEADRFASPRAAEPLEDLEKESSDDDTEEEVHAKSPPKDWKPPAWLLMDPEARKILEDAVGMEGAEPDSAGHRAAMKEAKAKAKAKAKSNAKSKAASSEPVKKKARTEKSDAVRRNLQMKDHFSVESTELVKVLLKAERNSFFYQFVDKTRNRVVGAVAIGPILQPCEYVNIATELRDKIHAWMLPTNPYVMLDTIKENFKLWKKQA